MATEVNGSGTGELVDSQYSSIKGIQIDFQPELGKPRHTWGQKLEAPDQRNKCTGTKFRVQFSMEIQFGQKEPEEETLKGDFEDSFQVQREELRCHSNRSCLPGEWYLVYSGEVRFGEEDKFFP